MTVTQKLYQEINTKLIDVIEGYKDQISQRDMLFIATNLLVSQMQVMNMVDGVPREVLIAEIIDLINSIHVDDLKNMEEKKDE